jgi:hypothetical protein
MERTSFQLYHGENKFSAISRREQVFSYIMERTSFQLYHDENKFSAISWREQVFSYIMERTSFQLYHGENKFLAISWREQVTFDEKMKMFALYKVNTLSWIIIVPVHWSNSQFLEMSFHSVQLPWFQANHLVLHHNAACFEEKQYIPIF